MQISLALCHKFLNAKKARRWHYMEELLWMPKILPDTWTQEIIDQLSAYLMYRDDKERMWQRNIIPTLQNITRTFSQTLNYFSIINERHSASKFSLQEIHFQNGAIVFDK
jgi:hypothetical protein